eukprot:1148251-Pelagomonas_calceolata.AAC.18
MCLAHAAEAPAALVPHRNAPLLDMTSLALHVTGHLRLSTSNTHDHTDDLKSAEWAKKAAAAYVPWELHGWTEFFHINMQRRLTLTVSPEMYSSYKEAVYLSILEEVNLDVVRLGNSATGERKSNAVESSSSSPILKAVQVSKWAGWLGCDDQLHEHAMLDRTKN